MINRLKFLFPRPAFLFLLILTFSSATLAEETPLKIHYRLAMSQPNLHLFEVNIDVDIAAAANVDSLDFQMAKWSPGRYAVFDFAKNVQEVSANSRCAPNLECEQIILPITPDQGQTANASQQINIVLNWFTELQQRVPVR